MWRRSLLHSGVQSLRTPSNRWNKPIFTRFISKNATRSFSSNANALPPREQMEFDVVIVGAGPAGLGAAIRLKQLAIQNNQELSVCIVEKGAEVGSHILSGNVFEPRALNELIPDWKDKGAPLTTPVTQDSFHVMTSASSSIKIPNMFLPKGLHNDGNYIISLSNLCKWLASQAEELGVEIYPGFSASEVVYENDVVKGIATADLGIAKDGSVKDTFQRGMELRGKQTLFAEGCRGSLSELLMAKYNLREFSDPQTYGLGVKEIWEVDPAKHKAGTVQHTFGWPLDRQTYGGTFLYHMQPNLVLLGMVVGLDYKNPYLSPYEELQRWKHHPLIKNVIEGGNCISYGARCINEGGLQAIPKVTFPGGALIGCAPGFLDVPKIKGSHMAMKTGMMAAEAVFDHLTTGKEGHEATEYIHKLGDSWVYKDLHAVRNVHPSFKYGNVAGFLYSGLALHILKGREPWTWTHNTTDADATKKASECKPIEYPKPDGKISFDLLTNLARSGTNHEHDQPSHLKIKPGMESVPEQISLKEYAAPESRFCPARVYEYVPKEDSSELKLQINAQNCLHCKCCDIKTPKNYIKWTVPEGGGGPAYANM
eukprot:GILJ01004239.1.p1 GENE.GILJ01004239.1~~GILJ01004239.1.p1  ORF type:complete len:596 (+),score=71.44 GILJ01004239.1:43-1830(+)